MRRPLQLFFTFASVLSCVEAPTAPVVTRAEDPASTQQAPEATASGISFASLAPGDVLAVEIHASGCYHNDRYDLVFARDEAGSTRLSGRVTALAVPPPPDSPDSPRPTIRELTPQAVAPAELAGLDRLLAYYRGGPPDGCTSHIAVRLSLLRGGQVIREERYSDGSCSADDQPGVISLYALLWRERDAS